MWTTGDQKLGKNSRYNQNKQLKRNDKHRNMYKKPSLSTFPLENHKMEAICDTPYVLAYLWREIGAYLRIENSKKLYGGPNIEHN